MSTTSPSPSPRKQQTEKNLEETNSLALTSDTSIIAQEPVARGRAISLTATMSGTTTSVSNLSLSKNPVSKPPPKRAASVAASPGNNQSGSPSPIQDQIINHDEKKENSDLVEDPDSPPVVNVNFNNPYDEELDENGKPVVATARTPRKKTTTTDEEKMKEAQDNEKQKEKEEEKKKKKEAQRRKQHLIVGRRYIMNIHENSCYCIEYSHDEDICNIRRAFFRAFDHWLFDLFLVLLILYNLGYFIFDAPFGRALPGGAEVVEYSEYVIQGLFTIEIIMKIISLGFALHPYAYCRDPLRFLEMIVVICGFIAIPLVNTKWKVLRNLKLIRLFRVLERIMQYVPELRGIFDALVGGLPRFADIIMFVSFLVLGLSIVGIQLFRGQFHNRCYFRPPSQSLNDSHLLNDSYSADYSEQTTELSSYSYNNLNFTDQVTTFLGSSDSLWSNGIFNATETIQQVDPSSGNVTSVAVPRSTVILDPLNHWPCALAESDTGGLTPCDRGAYCMKNTSIFSVPYTNFDHLGHAAFTVLKLTSIDNIQDEIRRMSYTVGPVSGIFGIIVVFLIAFCAMNFFIALLSWEYDIACQRHLPARKRSLAVVTRNSADNTPIREETSDDDDDDEHENENESPEEVNRENNQDQEPQINDDEDDEKLKQIRKTERARQRRIRKLEKRLELKAQRKEQRKQLEESLPPWSDPLPLDDDEFLPDPDRVELDDLLMGRPLKSKKTQKTEETDKNKNEPTAANKDDEEMKEQQQQASSSPTTALFPKSTNEKKDGEKQEEEEDPLAPTKWEIISNHLRYCIGISRLFLYRYFVGTDYFFWFSVLVTVINVVILAIFYEGMPQELADIFNWINFGCGIFFLFEMVIKILVLFPKNYFLLKTNIFDFGLACAIIAELATLGGSGSSSVFGALRAVRMLRIFSLAVKFERPRQTLLTVASAAKASFMLFLLLLAYVAISALFAVYLFEDAIPISSRPNFTDIPQAILAMFIILAGESWTSIVIQTMQGSTGAAAVFFFIFFFFGTYLLLNLFVVIVIASYKHTAEEIAAWKLKEQQEQKREKEKQRMLTSMTSNPQTEENKNNNIDGITASSPTTELITVGRKTSPDNNNNNNDAVDEFQQNIVRSIDRGYNNNDSNNNTTNTNTNILNTIPKLDIDAFASAKEKQTQMERIAAAQQQQRRGANASPLDTAPPSAQITSRNSKNSPNQNTTTSDNNNTVSISIAAAENATNAPSSPNAKSTTLGRTVREKRQKTWAHRLSKFMGQEEYYTSEEVRESLQGDSFYIFGPENCFRVFCAVVARHPLFEFCTTLVILESLIVLGFETKKNIEDINYLLSDGLESDPFRINNIFITCWFFTEMLLKMIAFGVFVKESPKHKTYFSEAWNQFDFIVVIITILSNVVPVSFLKALRIFRFAAKWHNQKVVLSAMLRAIPEFLNVVGLVLAFVFLVAVLGVQLFQGRFSSCNDPDILLRTDCIGNFTQERIWYEQKSTPIYTNASNTSSEILGTVLATVIHNSTAIVPRRWTTPFYNYDNTPNGLVSSLLLFWNDGWVPVLFTAVDSSSNSNIGLQPTDWSTVPVLYFVGFTIIGNFFLHNLFIGTLLDLFKREHKREVGLSDEEGNQLLTSEQEEWIRNFRFAQATSLPDPPPPAYNRFRQFCCYLYFQDDQVREDVSSLFEFTISICVFINVALMATEYDGMSEFWEGFLFYENLVLTIIFAFEVIISFTALLPRAFLDDSNNIFNALVTIASFISLRFSGPGINVLRVIRIFRILRVIKRARGVYRLFQALVYSVPQIANVSILVVLILYVFGITATQLFGNAFIDFTDPNEPLGHDYNFQHAGYSILTLIQLATTDGWARVMEKMSSMSPENSGCSTASNADSDSNLACGNWYAIPFFTLFILVAHSIAINLYIFVIVDNVLELNELNDVRTQWMLTQLSDFRKLWMQFDKRRYKQLRWQYLVLILRHMLVMEKSSLKSFRREIGVPIRVFRSTVEDTLVVESLINERSADKHSAVGLELQLRSYYKRLRKRERRRRIEKLRQEYIDREMKKQRKAVEAAAQQALTRNAQSRNPATSPFMFGGGDASFNKSRRRDPPGAPFSSSTLTTAQQQQQSAFSNSNNNINHNSQNPNFQFNGNGFEIILPEELEMSSSSSDSDFYEDENEETIKKDDILSSSSSDESVHEQIRRVKKRKMLQEQGREDKRELRQVKMRRRKSSLHSSMLNKSNRSQSVKSSQSGFETGSSQSTSQRLHSNNTFAESVTNVSTSDIFGVDGTSTSAGENNINNNKENNNPDSTNNNTKNKKNNNFSVYHANDVDEQIGLDRRMDMKHVALSVIAQKNINKSDGNQNSSREKQKQGDEASANNNNNNNNNKNNNNNNSNEIDEDTWCVSEKFLLKRLESLAIPVMRGGFVDYSDCIFGLTRAHSGSAKSDLSGYAKEYLARVRDVDYSQTFQVHHAVAAMKIWRWWKRINTELEKEMEEAAMDFMLRAALDHQQQQQQQLQRSQLLNNSDGGDSTSHNPTLTNDSFDVFGSHHQNENSAAAAALAALQKAGKMEELKKAVERRNHQMQRRHEKQLGSTTGGSSLSRSGTFDTTNNNNTSSARRRRHHENRFRVQLPDPNSLTRSSTEFMGESGRNSMFLGSTAGGGGAVSSGESRNNTPGRRRRSVTLMHDDEHESMFDEDGNMMMNNNNSRFLHPAYGSGSVGRRRSTVGGQLALPPPVDTSEHSCSTDPLPPDLSEALTRHLEREIEKVREENETRKRQEEEKIAAEIKRRMQLEAKAKRQAAIRSGKRAFGHKPGTGAVIGIKRKKSPRQPDEEKEEKEKETAATSVSNNNNQEQEKQSPLTAPIGDHHQSTRAPSPFVRTGAPDQDLLQQQEQELKQGEIHHDNNQDKNQFTAKVGSYKYFNEQNSLHPKSKVQELVEERNKERAPPSIAVSARAGNFAYYQQNDKNNNNNNENGVALSSRERRLSPEMAEMMTMNQQQQQQQGDEKNNNDNNNNIKTFESTKSNPINKHLGRVQALLNTTRRRQKEVERQQEQEKLERAQRAEELEQRRHDIRHGIISSSSANNKKASSFVLKQVEDDESKKKFDKRDVLGDDNLDTIMITSDDDDTDDDEKEQQSPSNLTTDRQQGPTRETTDLPGHQNTTTAETATSFYDDVFDDLTDQRPPVTSTTATANTEHHQRSTFFPLSRRQNNNNNNSTKPFTAILTLNKIAKCCKRFDPQLHRQDYQQLFSFIPNDAPLLAVSVGQLVSVHDTIVSGTPKLFGWALCARIAKPSLRGYIPIDCICDAVSGASIVGQQSAGIQQRQQQQQQQEYFGDDEDNNNNNNPDSYSTPHQEHQQQQPQTFIGGVDTSLVQSPKRYNADNAQQQQFNNNNSNLTGLDRFVKKNEGKRAFVRYNFDAIDPVELSVRAGELVEIEEEEHDGWTRVRNIGGGRGGMMNNRGGFLGAHFSSPDAISVRTGLVPTDYLKILDAASAPQDNGASHNVLNNNNNNIDTNSNQHHHQHQLRTPSLQKNEDDFFSPNEPVHQNQHVVDEEQQQQAEKGKDSSYEADINQPLFVNKNNNVRLSNSRNTSFSSQLDLHAHNHQNININNNSTLPPKKHSSSLSPTSVSLEQELTVQLDRIAKVEEQEKQKKTSEQSVKERLEALKARLKQSRSAEPY